MKKILTILTLASALFLTACGDSKPSYDFSSEESIQASFIEQGAKEGFSEMETFAIFHRYQKYIKLKQYEETKEDGLAFPSIDYLKKYTQGVTFSEMKKIGDDFYEKRKEAEAK